MSEPKRSHRYNRCESEMIEHNSTILHLNCCQLFVCSDLTMYFDTPREEIRPRRDDER